MSSFTPHVTSKKLIAVSAEVGPFQNMSTTSYSFAVWSTHELQMVKNVKIASMDNWSGSTIKFSLDAIKATLDAWDGDTDSTTVVPFPAVTTRQSGMST